MSTFPHAKRRNTLKAVLVWALMMVPASALLYSTSSHVRELEKEQASINQQIAHQKESLRVMQAEWAYLNNPQRLSARAKTYLGFKTTTSAKQIAQINDMSMKVAYRGEEMSIAQAASLAGMQQQAAARTATQPLSTKVLAKPIAYQAQLGDSRLVDALAQRNVKLPAAAGWQEKVVSFNATETAPVKGRTIP